MDNIKHRATRVKAKRPIALEKAVDEVKLGLMQDISASGIYFECNLDRSIGSEVRFAINVDLPEGHLTLECHAEIVRIDTRDDKNFIAAKIIQSKIIS
ncbi:MAG: hypothetical protein RLZZ434_427 [Pseudomonadota bacterium]|jgi:hypothetical protein